jgi:thymidylate synthase
MIGFGSPSFASLDDAYIWIVGETMAHGAVASPRGRETRELLGVTFTLRDPRRRCLNIRARRWSLPLAIGEFCWHVSASDELSSIAYYAPIWREFSDDQISITGSCYGKRIFGRELGERSQWDLLIQTLEADPNSRRAILTFHQVPQLALQANATDVACATSLQFFIRQGKLHAISYMRSNDVIWGFPYDVFLFSMMQEMMAVRLGLELGEYAHMVGSMHIYSGHYGLAEKILASPSPDDWAMPSMDSLEHLPEFLLAESKIRRGEPHSIGLSGYWRDLADVLTYYSTRRSTPASGRSRLPVSSPYKYHVVRKDKEEE